MKEPVDHIVRPQLPWRLSDAGAITECGLDASKVKTISRDEFASRMKDLGSQRTALLTCMTCSDTAQRWGTWDDDPRGALQREIAWEFGGAYCSHAHDDTRGTKLKDELTAIASLIAAYRAEFDAAVAEISGRRDWNNKKAALSVKRKKAVVPVGRL